MLHICSLSGEELRVPVEAVSSVRDVKRCLHQLHGLPPRFRQRLLLEGTNLEDAEKLDAPSPLDLELVVLPYSTTSQTEVDKLRAAASHGSVEEVESLLQLPLDPNVTAAGRTLLVSAAAAGHADVVRLLLEAGADKDAAHGRDEETRSSSDSDSDSNSGYTALMVAAHCGHADVVRVLVEAGADKEVADEWGFTALMLATFQGNAEVVRLLLEAGADKDAAGCFGDTTLMLAARSGQVDVVRLLEEAGAKGHEEKKE